MTRNPIIAVVLASAALNAAPAIAASAVMQQVTVTPIASPHRGDALRPRLPWRADALMDAMPVIDSIPTNGRLDVYPLAGTLGRDVVIPYYFDVNGGAGRLDYKCGSRTFEDHKGHDPYIRSFAEQAIGVPVFAAADGVVIGTKDGEPDEVTNNDPAAIANYVTIDHGNGLVTEYVHLKRDSVGVTVGQFVTAGTQIGMAGSSGVSSGPHIHFEVRRNGVPIEPFAGPCRPGASFFPEQPDTDDRPIILGATFSEVNPRELRSAPYDDAPHTGTFVKGRQVIYFKADIADVDDSTRYLFKIDPPVGSTFTAGTGSLQPWDASIVSVVWAFDVDLDRTGNWAVNLELNDKTYVFPFKVVSGPSSIVNRAPEPILASIEPTGLTAGDVAVCRATRDGLADADYDVLSYRYEWRVNGEVVRAITSAAMSDALAKQFVTPNASINCTVTVTDGKAQAQPATANAGVSVPARRRAVRR